MNHFGYGHPAALVTSTEGGSNMGEKMRKMSESAADVLSLLMRM